MDVSFFRFLAPEVADAVHGVRFDTVFSPAPGFWTFAFTPPVLCPAHDANSPAHAAPGCRFLLIRVHTREGILFLSPAKPANPPEPPARAMWLRKRLRGRRLAGALVDWPRRRLAFTLSDGQFLLLAMEDDPVVLERLPDDFGHIPQWKSPDEALADPACPRSLRAALTRGHAEEWEPRGQAGHGAFSAFTRGSAKAPAARLEAFLAGRAEGFFKGCCGPLPWPPKGPSEHFGGALEAAAAHGRKVFFEALAPREENPARVRVKKDRLLAHLAADQERLEALTRQGLFGEAVAANLSALDPRAKTGPLALTHPEHGSLEVPFDPSLTIVENMERFFRKAAKGRRGLRHVSRLLRDVEEGALPVAGRKGGTASSAGSPQKASPARKGHTIPLHRFRSSDGFLIVRGKNSAANHKLLSELASPFDYWFHAEGGPGAHVILKRDHPGQDVPERTLREAAILAGLASWRGQDAKADVLMALCSDVRKTKGAPLGQVRVASGRALLVELDPSLEARLRLDG